MLLLQYTAGSAQVPRCTDAGELHSLIKFLSEQERQVAFSLLSERPASATVKDRLYTPVGSEISPVLPFVRHKGNKKCTSVPLQAEQLKQSNTPGKPPSPQSDAYANYLIATDNCPNMRDVPVVQAQRSRHMVSHLSVTSQYDRRT
jgi:hypothetical protein